MSKGRMNDLLRALEADGWVLLNPQGEFSVEDEIVNWNLEHPEPKTRVNLDFHIFGDLGERSESIKDIHYCAVRDRGIELYFKKRESEKWRHSLVEFVEAIRSCLHEGDQQVPA